jgi:hypothetical protein
MRSAMVTIRSLFRPRNLLTAAEQQLLIDEFQRAGGLPLLATR